MESQQSVPPSFLPIMAGTEDAGRRIDRVVRKFLKEIAMTEIYRGFRKGLIKVNGKKVSPDTKVSQGDILWIHTSIGKSHTVPAQAISTETKKNQVAALEAITLFKNSNIIVLNKPYGMPVHGGGTIRTEETADYLVKQVYAQTEAATQSLSFTPGPLHRIDRNTSGLIVFSQSLKGATCFSQLLQEGRLKKQYLGLVIGKPVAECWTDFTERDDDAHVSRQSEDGQATVTDVMPLVSNNGMTLALFTIHTGRTHQIRLQCSLHGCPLAGDAKYGGATPDAPKHYFLHAWHLTFPSNSALFTEKDSGTPSLTFTAPPPNDFIREINRRFRRDLLVSSAVADLYCEHT